MSDFGYIPGYGYSALETLAPPVTAGLGTAAGAGSGLGTLGTAARIAGLGTKAGVSELGLTGARALGYRFLPAAAGFGVGMGADRLSKAAGIDHNSAWSDVGEGAAGGAAAGTVAGLLGGPFAPISVPVGAAVGTGLGAVVGGVGHFLFGGKKDSGSSATDWDKESMKLIQAAQAQGLDPQTLSALQGQYGIYLQSQLTSAQGDKAKEATIRQQAYQALTNNVMGALNQKAAGGLGGGVGTSGPSTQDQLAAQALTASFIRPYVDESMASAKQTGSMLSDLGSKIGGPTGQAIQAQGAAAASSAQRTALAYASQVQMAPQAYAFEQQQKQYQALAAQLQQYALQRYLTNPEGSFTPSWGGGGLGGLSAAGGAPDYQGLTTTKQKAGG